MRPSTRKWLFGLLALLLAAAAATRVGPLNVQRDENHLRLEAVSGDALSSGLATPLLAVGRAILADVYWMMATKSKDEGRIFDAYQLAKRICELQPRFASVWVFQAWNMSYNISVTLKSPEERWRWVRNGFELLRDKAIPLNPNSTQLYKELAWIFFHKVGDSMDEWHYYYKLQFALQMEDILGTPPPDYARPGRSRGEFYRRYDFESLVTAPQTVTELLNEPGVAEFCGQLDAFGFDARESGIYLGLLNALAAETAQVPNAAEGEKETRLRALKQLMADPQTEPARRTIERYWRSHRLRNEVKLDPQRIIDLQTSYNVSFDWRLPESHALYWASLGLERGVGRQEAIDVHKLNTNRIEFYCIQKMFHRGRLTMSRNARLGEPPLLSPDYRMIPILREAFERDSVEYLKRENVKKPVSENFKSGYVGFMRSAVIRYHEAGKQAEALELFEFLKEHFPDPMYERGIDGFLAEQFREDRKLEDYRVTMARVSSLIARGLEQLAYDEDEDGGRYLARARQVYDRYQAFVASDRLKIPATYSEILEGTLHEFGASMYRNSYEHICEKLGIKPLPPRDAGPSPSP